MNNPADKGGQHPKTKHLASPGARRVGYSVTIIVMFILIYVLRHLREWGLTFLNEDFDNALLYLEISIYATIAANVLFLLYDNRWFRHLLLAVTNIASAIALIMLYVIFPFNVTESGWVKGIQIGLLILFGLTVLSVLSEVIKGIRYLLKDPQAA